MERFFGLCAMVAGSPAVLMAYTDPGTGMLVWQTILAISIGFFFTTRRGLAKALKRNNQ